MRLDVFLTVNEFCESRNKASSLIRDGRVTVNGKIVKKLSFDVCDNDVVDIDTSYIQYVARSAHKLFNAKQRFNLNFKDKVVVDLGSSTGGFCQILLQEGANKVFAVDIGTNQLHPKLRNDERIVVMENTNARYIDASCFYCKIDTVTCDLSFISLKKVLQAVYGVLKNNGEFICLVKPQFEVGPECVNKNGVVKDRIKQAEAVIDVVKFAYRVGFSVCDICFSGLEGESGNREFFLYMKKDDRQSEISFKKIIDEVTGVKR